MNINFKRLSAVAALAVALVATVATPAPASSLGTYNGSGIRIRSGPSASGTTVYGLGYFGQKACVYFAVEGEYVEGNPYWDYHYNQSTGVSGYSSDAYMYPFYYGQSC